ncbi:BEN domain-containing protein 5-like [Ixodes scapularis]|uniref:BEN domain-containing protein 5-like n=1 Tax=Ixodes scapularis TaxID=6945 RepID=UPI001161A354|nr:BEN domain-containing protein 5-like [Ixodes scapularis]
MYAFVRFQDDAKKLVVPVVDVKNFTPAHTKDFNGRCWYDVWWQDQEDDEQTGYYRAQIIKLYRTQEEAEEEWRTKRVPIPKPPSDEESDSESTSEDSGAAVSQSQKSKSEVAKKKRSEAVLQAYKKQQSERLYPDEDVQPDPLVIAHAKIRQLKKELKEVRLQNSRLQTALCCKVLQKEREQERGYARTTGACNNPRPFSPAVQGSGAPVPLASGAGSQVQASPYIQRPASVPASVHSSPEELPIPARDPSPHDLFEVEEDQAAPLGQPTLFQTGGEKVYVGANIWVPSKSYSDLLARTRDSLFVREAAVIIFSTSGLAGKSVTGISSNRTKNSPKPALEDFKFKALGTFFLHYLVHRCKCNPKCATTCKCKVKSDCKCEAQHGCQIPKRLALLNKHVASKIMDIARREGRK